MKSGFLQGLTFRVGAVIVLTEVLVLAALGVFYTGRFSAQVDQDVRDRVMLPGILINGGRLDIDAVADKATMERLVGRDLVELADGMVVGATGNVFHALDPADQGRDVTELNDVDPSWFTAGSTDDLIETRSADGGPFLVSVTPLFLAEGQAPFLFSLIRIDVSRAEAAKAAIARYFALGSLLAVALTSLVIMVSFQTAIAARLGGVLAVLRSVEAGDLHARVEGQLASDEIGEAQRGVNAMASRLQETIGDLRGNVSGLQQAHAEREGLIAELEERNTELERFTYTVSHDLKAPLVTIKGFLGLLEKDAASGDAERMRQDVAQIGGAADKMGQLLDEVLELSRIGRLVNPPEPVALSELADEAVSLLAGKIRAREVDLVVQRDMPMVLVDRVRALEVLLNLVDNSVKFMGDQSNPHVHIRADAVDGWVTCSVQDNGLGIDDRYKESVFGLFNRLDPESEGTGIGLALARRIVEVHGGTIWVEPREPGQGSTFLFTLPAETGPTPG